MRRPLPPRPTFALPGTAEKIEVLAWRRQEHYQLHHPEDAMIPYGHTPLSAGRRVPAPEEKSEEEAYQLFLETLQEEMRTCGN